MHACLCLPWISTEKELKLTTCSCMPAVHAASSAPTRHAARSGRTAEPTGQAC